MQICSALLPSNTERLETGDVSSESPDIGPCVMCVARRIPPNEKPVGTPIEQFTVKLDTAGKIIAVDVSWLSSAYAKYLTKVRVCKTFLSHATTETFGHFPSIVVPRICDCTYANAREV